MGLFKLIAKELGYTRLNETTLSYLENALKLLDGIIEIDGNMLSIK